MTQQRLHLVSKQMAHLPQKMQLLNQQKFLKRNIQSLAKQLKDI